MKNKDLVRLLRQNLPDTSFLNKLKIVYRPYILPFSDLLSLVPPQSAVFDIGCGSGMFLMLLAELRSPEKLGGVEIKEELIQNAQKLLQRYDLDMQLHVFDGKILPDSLNLYSHITMIDVLHHIPKQAKTEFLEQIYQKMHSGAYFVFKDIDASALPWIYFNKLHDFIFSQEIGSEWTCSKFTETALKIGFKIKQIVKKRMYVYPHYTVVLEK